MPRLEWDATGEHLYETGTKNGVLYPISSKGVYDKAVVWNGLTAVTESPEGAEATPLYADDIKYLNLYSAEEFKATIEAYMYPDEFAILDGSAAIADGVYIGQQSRGVFGFSYSTVLGNDVENNNYGEKIHIIYGAMASPSERPYVTVNDSPEIVTFSWEVNTTPVNVAGFKPTSVLTIDSTKADKDCFANLKAILHGANDFDEEDIYAVGDYVVYTDVSAETTKLYRCKTAITTPGSWDESKWDEIPFAPGPRLPLPDEIKSIMTKN